MTSSLGLAVVSALSCLLPTVTFSEPPPISAAQMWREIAPGHYHNNECCYCRQVDKVGPSPRTGYGSYKVLGKWYTMPDYAQKKPDPIKPENGVVICDPIERNYMCIIPGISG